MGKGLDGDGEQRREIASIALHAERLAELWLRRRDDGDRRMPRLSEFDKRDLDRATAILSAVADGRYPPERLPAVPAAGRVPKSRAGTGWGNARRLDRDAA